MGVINGGTSSVAAVDRFQYDGKDDLLVEVTAGISLVLMEVSIDITALHRQLIKVTQRPYRWLYPVRSSHQSTTSVGGGAGAA